MKGMRIPVVVSLTVLWTMLWGDVNAINVIGGLVVSTLVVLVFPFPHVEVHGAFRPWPVIVLLSHFLRDLVVASFQVAWLVLRPQAPPPSAMIEVPLVTSSELLQTITGELVSLVPGSLLIELDSQGHRMWLHVLNAATEDHIESARRKAQLQEYRVLAAFGTAQDRAASARVIKEETA